MIETLQSAQTLHFLRPWWLLGVIPALFLAVVWARRRMSASHWENAIEPSLLGVLLEPGSVRGFKKLAWLVAAGLAVAAVGISGPAWERLPQPVEQKNDALTVVLDLSLSMFAPDVQPSRLIRARQKITDVLRQRKEGFTALVVYAGDAHIVTPLTDDTNTIENLLAALSPDMMPVLGSNLESALEVTATLFANARITQGRTLLVTDGIDDLSHATDFCTRTFPLSILGVGTPEGSTIPLDFVNQPGRILRTQNGNPVIARLDETELSKAASRCYGRYERLTLGDNDVSRLLATPLPQDDESIEVEREFDSWSDMGFLVCLVLLPLILFGFRRGMFTVLLLVMLPRPGHAGIWEDLWQRSDQQAVVALRDGQPERASSLFNDLAWQAVARYRAEDFSGAADGFARTEGPEGSYNLGNAYAQNGNFQAAIEAYDKTLETQPDHEDALFNRNLAQQLLEEQEAAEQDSSSEGNNGANPEDSSQPQDGGEPQPSDNPEQDGQQADQPPDQQDADGSDPQDGDDNQRSETDQGDSNRDERQDALEQWLRRVPDDPGGLLRRKFQYETNQRLRRGDYRSRETEKIW